MQSKGRKRNTRRGGFTLIEVMLVLIILVIIGSLAVNTFSGAQEAANIRAARAQVGLVRSAIDRYRLDMNKYPSQLQDLWEEPSDKAQAELWLSGPYIDKMKPDPWGNEYQYAAEGKKNADKYDFWSNGPDGKDGTEDDIGNWDDES
ncbi:MAG: type II secretion system major pseudopilin GspG [Planctomycetota bacterium]